MAKKNEFGEYKVLNSQVSTARKEHTCFECDELICVGDTYANVDGLKICAGHFVICTISELYPEYQKTEGFSDGRS